MRPFPVRHVAPSAPSSAPAFSISSAALRRGLWRFGPLSRHLALQAAGKRGAVQLAASGSASWQHLGSGAGAGEGGEEADSGEERVAAMAAGRTLRRQLQPLRLVDKAGHHVNPASRSRLDNKDAAIFDGGTLYARLGRVVCAANCLPRKEFFEAWEVGRRVQKRFHRLFKEYEMTVVDLAAGHGFLAWVLLLSEPRIRTAICVDMRKPASALRLEAAILETWPHLAGRLRYVEGDMRQVSPDSQTLLVSVHACGKLTDIVLDLALRAHAPVAVMPCCHVVKRSLPGAFDGWLEGPIAIDVQRASRLQAAGFEVFTQLIPAEITAENRLLMGMPKGQVSATTGSNLSPDGSLDTEGEPILEGDDVSVSRHKQEDHTQTVWPKRVLPASPWHRFGTRGI